MYTPPFRVVAAFDGLVEVAAVGLAVAADQFGRFVVGEILDALLGAEVELDPVALAFGVDQAVGV